MHVMDLIIITLFTFVNLLHIIAERPTSSNLTTSGTGTTGDEDAQRYSYHRLLTHLLRDPRAKNDLAERLRPENIRYLLRSKTGKWEEIERSGADATTNGRWKRDAKVKVLIHGYSPPEYEASVDMIGNSHIYKIGDAYAARGANCNVIIMDWTAVSSISLYNYYEAVSSIAYVGHDVAVFLRKLKSLRLISTWEDVHIIGLSLGAHVAGIAGAEITKFCGGVKVGRITGLDPAGPLFEQNTNNWSDRPHALNRSHATFVDVVHCTMGVGRFAVLRGKFGTSVQSGHADFYPDGGETQKNCTVLRNVFETCSHFKCALYFAQSVSEYYGSCPCSSWEDFKGGKCPCSRNDGREVAMGEQCSTRARGKYYRYM